MKIKKKLSALIFCFLLCTAIVSCSKSGGTQSPPGLPTYPPPPPVGAGDIGMYGMSFSPSTFTVKVGTTVKWTNNDNTSHTVISDDGTTFKSGTIAVGASFSFTPTAVGSLLYHCNFHGGMTGTLKVTN